MTNVIITNKRSMLLGDILPEGFDLDKEVREGFSYQVSN